jgi:hypothetical protein
MPRPSHELLRIATAGGGLTIDAALWEFGDLIKIAEAAGKHGGRIHITNISMWDTDELVRLAEAGKGSVSFEI